MTANCASGIEWDCGVDCGEDVFGYSFLSCDVDITSEGRRILDTQSGLLSSGSQQSAQRNQFGRGLWAQTDPLLRRRRRRLLELPRQTGGLWVGLLRNAGHLQSGGISGSRHGLSRYSRSFSRHHSNRRFAAIRWASDASGQQGSSLFLSAVPDRVRGGR